MATAAVIEGVAAPVFTKEELDALRRRLASVRAAAGADNAPPGADDTPNFRPEDWEFDAKIIIKFLLAVQSIMRFLLDSRIPVKARALITPVMENASENLESAIGELEAISLESDDLYQALKRERLTADDLVAKVSAFVDDLDDGPVAAVLGSADKILGSLVEALPVLHPVIEAKELLEHRIKYRGDAGLISLNIYGDK